MQTTDPRLLFQSDRQLDELANRERKLVAAEKVGRPIPISSKVLDLAVQGQDGYTAESGWQARRLDLYTGSTHKLFKGHKGPVTCVTFHLVNVSEPRLLLITSSWDKTIRIWDTETGECVHILEGHSDFVKSVKVIPSNPPLLLSTSSDRTCRVWDLSPLAFGGSPVCTQTIKDHTRPVECSTYRPSPTSNAFSIWTADSMGVIRQWGLEPPNLTLIPKDTIIRHETSVTALYACEDGLWSASADKTARFTPENGPVINLVHPSAVKSILVLPPPLIGQSLVVTGSEDEVIRVFDLDNSTEGSNVEPISQVEGHCGEISSLAIWVPEESGRKHIEIVSGGLDSTLRRWPLDELLNPKPLDYTSVSNTRDGGMTEEEERELEELMGDDD